MNSDRKNGDNGEDSPVILPSFAPMTLLGGGPVCSETLRSILDQAPVLVAADGGAAHALKVGKLPDAVIGDLDSLDPATRAAIPPERVHHITEQDSTDFDKALRHVSAPVILALGFLGARLDHELAAYHTLVAHPGRLCILIGPVDIVLHVPPALDLMLPPGTRFSLFPMQTVHGTSLGLEWPIDGMTFHPATRIGTSNRVTEGAVSLRMEGPGMLLILPRAHLDAVLQALLPQGPGGSGAD